jgi:hypothetical protein
MSSKDHEAVTLEAFEPYKNQESVTKLRDVLRARVELHRDRLEKEESDEHRGRLKELRDLLRILSE